MSGNSDHGFDAHFDPELDKKYICPVCLAAMRNPVQTKCGHRFCNSCLRKSIGRYHRFARCPVDNTWFDVLRDIFTDNAVKREILSLSVRCENQAHGCAWRGELRGVATHLKTCSEAQLQCPNKCKHMCKRKEMPCHLAECPLRLEPCLHCAENVTVSNMTKHQVLKCTKFPVSCPVCGEPGILRENVATHVDCVRGDCPLVTVHCSFSSVGCKVQEKRQNLNFHYRNGVNEHLLLLCARLVSQEERLARQERQIELLQLNGGKLMRLAEQQNRIVQEHGLVLQHFGNRLELLEKSKTD